MACHDTPLFPETSQKIETKNKIMANINNTYSNGHPNRNPFAEQL
jgi:hypothetical protein